MKKYFCLISIFLLTSCYKTIDIDVDQGYQQLVVDGMLVFDPTNPLKQGGDVIKLSYTSKFVSNESTVPFINDASVILKDSLGNIDQLVFTSNGEYVTQTTQKRPGAKYRLEIKLANNEEYYAETFIPLRNADFRGLPQPKDANGNLKDTCRTTGTPIGVIPYGPFVDLDLYDLPGKIADAYWIQPFVRRIKAENSPYNPVSGLNIGLGTGNSGTISSEYGTWNTFRGTSKIILALDFSNGRQNSESFGNENPVKMILPLRLNAVMSPNDQGSSDYPFYFPGDSVKVKVFAITLPQLEFLSSLVREMSNGTGGGLSGLFSRPPANTPTNIINKDANGKKAVGWFGGAMVVEKSTRINVNSIFIKNQAANAAKIASDYPCK